MSMFFPRQTLPMSRSMSGGVQQMMEDMQHQMDMMLDNTLSSMSTANQQPLLLPSQQSLTSGSARDRFMPIDVVEELEQFIVMADMPGVLKECIDVEVDQGNTLRISVNHAHPTEPGGKWLRNERSTAYRLREVRMPENADLSDISAKMENGVLKINIKKTKHHEPKAVLIQ